MEQSLEFVEDTYDPDRYGALELMRRARTDQLSMYTPVFFERNMLAQRYMFLSTYFLNKPEYIEHVLLGNHRNYLKSPLVRQVLRPTLGNGLVTSEGDFWRRQRRIVAPAFHHQRIANLVEVMAACAATTVERWQGQHVEFDVLPEMMGLTLEVIARTMFSTDVTPEIPRVRQLMDVIIRDTRVSAVDLLGLPEWFPRYRKLALARAIVELKALFSRIIALRRADGADRGDLLSMLMARDPETGEGMSDAQLKDEIATIFGAGHETTANALSWVWYLLARNPEAESLLHQEVDRVLGGRVPCYADLAELKYTRMVFEEAMRLYPPAHSIARTAVAEDRIGGVRVPAGANVTISPYVTHRSARYWPEPERFDPERFAPEAVARRHRFAYLPFGGGPRICIGASFAISEAQVIIASVAQRFRLRLDPAHKVVPIGYVTLRAKDGIRVRLERR